MAKKPVVFQVGKMHLPSGIKLDIFIEKFLQGSYKVILNIRIEMIGLDRTIGQEKNTEINLLILFNDVVVKVLQSQKANG